MGSLRPLATSHHPPLYFVGAAHAARRSPAPASAPKSRLLARIAAGVCVAVGVAGTGYVAWLAHDRVAGSDASVVVSGTPSLKTANSHHERWGAHPVTLTLDRSLDDLDANAKDAVRRAFGSWASIDGALPPLAFASDQAPAVAARDGVNRVLWGPITVPGHEKDVAVTISYTSDATGEILEADIVLNSAYRFGVLDEEEGTSCKHQIYDVQNVATHEAGHLFGLGEDMDDTHATMYVRSAPCQTHKRSLTAPDRTVMAALYEEPAPGASASASAGGCGGQARIASGQATSAPGALLVVAFAGLLRILRRRGHRHGAFAHARAPSLVLPPVRTAGTSAAGTAWAAGAARWPRTAPATDAPIAERRTAAAAPAEVPRRTLAR